MPFLSPILRYLQASFAAGTGLMLRPGSGNEVPPNLCITEFAQALNSLVLRNHPFPPSQGRMLEGLLAYRFPFTQANLGIDFQGQVAAVMAQFPVVLLQLLMVQKMTIELDVVCDTAAIMDPEQRKLMLSRYFVMDGALHESCRNVVYPYGLAEMILHELGHCCDFFLADTHERLSASSVYLNAFAHDLQQIPPGTLQSQEICFAWRQRYGGYHKLPSNLRQTSDVSLFASQEEEVFAEAFTYLMTGHARAVIPQFFPNAIEAVRQLLTRAFAEAACPPQELTL